MYFIFMISEFMDPLSEIFPSFWGGGMTSFIILTFLWPVMYRLDVQLNAKMVMNEG